MTLERAERRLRHYDKALRVRRSNEQPAVLVERKTMRGRIGSVGPGGINWTPDVGRRREEGHVLVCMVPREGFDAERLLDSLKEADTWSLHNTSADPLWRRAEREDDAHKRRLVKARQDGIRYKAGEVWDRYAWSSKSRVSTYVKGRS